MDDIFKVLQLSTAHVTEGVAATLSRVLHPDADRDPDHWSYWIVGTLWSDYGWFIWADIHDGVEDLPECLTKAFEYAKQRDCRWIQFDCDVAPIEHLQIWEW